MPTFDRYSLRFVVAFAIALAAWLIGGQTLQRAVSEHSNARQLEGLSQQLVRRAEKAIDFVVIANSEFLLAGFDGCTAPAIESLRRLVIETGTVADAHLISPGMSCSSFGELSGTLPDASERLSWEQARNPRYRIGALMDDRSRAIGVSWGLGSDLELVTAISADAILFDILPNEIRTYGRVELTVGSTVVASFAGDDAAAPDADETTGFEALGERYPVRAEISLGSEALSGWRTDVPAAVLWGWAVLGFAVAGLAGLASVGRSNKELDELKTALRNGEIRPYFQPIVDVRTGRLLGCEALARWIKRDGTFVPPTRFIPLIEQHRLNTKLLEMIVSTAAGELGEMYDRYPTMYVSINVTPDELCEAGFSTFLQGLASGYGLQPRQICIEVTERQEIRYADQAAANVQSLRRHGFRIAIDDAGTGHNGLAAMQMLEASILKIDKFFVDHINDDDRSTAILDLFVSAAKRFGMITVAEGVETEEQASALINAGVDAAQGYLFARPMPAADLLSFDGNEQPTDLSGAAYPASDQHKPEKRAA
ncbi:MAG: EAL domain-containing protein [Pseudomonadota bacterium]